MKTSRFEYIEFPLSKLLSIWGDGYKSKKDNEETTSIDCFIDINKDKVIFKLLVVEGN